MNRTLNRYDPVDGVILWMSLSAWILGYCTVCIHRQTYKQKSVVNHYLVAYVAQTLNPVLVLVKIIEMHRQNLL
jgi:hypothetical protein